MVLAGCGSSTAPKITALAIVDGSPVTRAQLQRNVDYVLAFSAWVYPGSSTEHGSGCTIRQRDIACTRLRRQVLARLLQARVLESYAMHHHIALSAADNRIVDRQVAKLAAKDAETASLLDGHLIDRHFMHDVIANERLIVKLRGTLFGANRESGMAYHVRRYEIPDTGHGYRQAVDLATDGRPVPHDAAVRDEWIAPFRLGSSIKASVEAASPGDFVGPFRKSGSYDVIQVLAYRRHRYGRPARELLESRLFATWLARELRRSAPRCFDPRGNRVACPLPNH